MAYATVQDVENQFEGISFDKSQAHTVLTAGGNAEIYISTDPNGEYSGKAGNSISIEVKNLESDGELNVNFDVDNDVLGVELGDSAHPASTIASKIDALFDFIAVEKVEGSFTTSDTMTQSLTGGADQSVIESALNEAERIVQDYRLMFWGYADGGSEGELIDYSSELSQEGLETGAKVWKVDEYGNKILTDNKPSEGTISMIDMYKIMFTPTYSNFSFKNGDRYKVENIQRRKMAEVYKACSLLLANLTSNAEVSSNVEDITVGDLEVEFGSVEEVAKAVDNNHFENKFRSIVGTWH